MRDVWNTKESDINMEKILHTLDVIATKYIKPIPTIIQILGKKVSNLLKTQGLELQGDINPGACKIFSINIFS